MLLGRNRMLVLGVVAVVLLAPAGAAASPPAHAPTSLFPTTIDLPDGFRPEGIAIGSLPYAYFGSLADGSIFRASLVTGRGRIISEGPGSQSVGLKVDGRGRLFVAGGTGGDARVVNAITGDVLAHYQFTDSSPTFVNDVILTPGAAWFTDYFHPVLYRVPLGRNGGLPEQDQIASVPLSGDYQHDEAGFNGNGISRTPDGKGLLLMQSITGLLFRVDPATGEATTVDLGGVVLTAGDGILLQGRTLYVVQNVLDQVAVLSLNHAGTSGTVVATITDPRFETPTTVAAFGDRLYLPNFRFGIEPTPQTPYTAIAVPRR